MPLTMKWFVIIDLVPVVQKVDNAISYTAISRKVVGKNVHVTSPRGNMGYDQYTVPDSVVVKTSFIAFL